MGIFFFQVEYDLSQPSGSRVVSVFTRCAACRVPTYSPLENEKTYVVLTVDFLHGGGDGYKMLQDLKWVASGKHLSKEPT